MTKRFFFTMMLFAFVFTVSACSGDGSKEVIGAWKTEENSKLSGKPDSLLIGGKTLDINNHLKMDVVFKRQDGKILMRKAGVADASPYIVTVIDKDTIKVDRGLLGEATYVRTTPEELQRIAASPGHVSKPDPF